MPPLEVALLTTQNTRLSAASAPKAYSQAVYATRHGVMTSTVLTTVVDFTPLSIAEFASAYRALWMSFLIASSIARSPESASAFQ